MIPLATQTYCTTDDLKAIISDQTLLRLIDDNEDGVANSREASYGNDAIVQAASQMNLYLKRRHRLSTLANSDWCRWCNAYLASQLLWRRRGNPAPPTLEAEAEQYREWLLEIRHARMDVPDTPPSVDPTPGVSNYTIDMRQRNPVRVRVEESVRKTADGVPRNSAWP